MQRSLKAISPAGKVLDARFSLEKIDSGFDVIIDSRSGTNKSGAAPRNPDYEDLFELVLIRAAAAGASLAGAWVASANTTHLPAESRRLSPPGMAFPVALPEVEDFDGLRMRICRMQGGIGRKAGATGPGNRNKRVLLRFVLEKAGSEADLVRTIVEGDDPAARAELIMALPEGDGPVPSKLNLAKIEALLNRYANATPAARRAAGKRIERGPIGNLLKSAHDYTCQICSAFERETRTFRKPDGQRYVEAHHVELVSSGSKGSLRAENVIVVCPTHHRELHYGAASVADQGDHFEVVVELGTTTIRKSNLALILEKTQAGIASKN